MPYADIQKNWDSKYSDIRLFNELSIVRLYDPTTNLIKVARTPALLIHQPNSSVDKFDIIGLFRNPVPYNENFYNFLYVPSSAPLTLELVRTLEDHEYMFYVRTDTVPTTLTPAQFNQVIQASSEYMVFLHYTKRCIDAQDYDGARNSIAAYLVSPHRTSIQTEQLLHHLIRLACAMCPSLLKIQTEIDEYICNQKASNILSADPSNAEINVEQTMIRNFGATISFDINLLTPEQKQHLLAVYANHTHIDNFKVTRIFRFLFLKLTCIKEPWNCNHNCSQLLDRGYWVLTFVDAIRCMYLLRNNAQQSYNTHFATKSFDSLGYLSSSIQTLIAKHEAELRVNKIHFVPVARTTSSLPKIDTHYDPSKLSISKVYKQSFPPCMRTMIDSATKKTNPSHLKHEERNAFLIFLFAISDPTPKNFESQFSEEIYKEVKRVWYELCKRDPTTRASEYRTLDQFLTHPLYGDTNLLNGLRILYDNMVYSTGVRTDTYRCTNCKTIRSNGLCPIKNIPDIEEVGCIQEFKQNHPTARYFPFNEKITRPTAYWHSSRFNILKQDQ